MYEDAPRRYIHFKLIGALRAHSHMLPGTGRLDYSWFIVPAREWIVIAR